MNVWDVLILLAVAALLARAVRRVRRGKTCGCGCDECACRGACAGHESKKEKTT